MTGVDGMRLDVLGERTRRAPDGDGDCRPLGPLSDPGQRRGRRAGRVVGGHRNRRRRRCVRISLGPTAIHCHPEDRTARSAGHSPHPAHRAGRRIRRHPPVCPRRPVAHGQLAGERAPGQPARHPAVDRPGRRRGRADRHVSATAGSGDGSDRTNAARRGSSGAERAAKRRSRRNRHARRWSTPMARRRYRTAAVLPGARHIARCRRRIRNHHRHIGAPRRPSAGCDRRRLFDDARHRVRAVVDRPAQARTHRCRGRRSRRRSVRG